jgi:1-acyl-sn-glycerol-3-phosphate acyltransferase
VIRAAIAVGFLAIFIPLAALVGFPWTFITGKADMLYRIAMWGAAAAIRMTGIRIVVEGRDRLEASQTYIFMSNHVSNVDPPILIPALPGRTSVLVKKEVFRVPILGRAMRLASLVPVERANREAAIASIGRAAEVLRKGIHMTVFPEGTRSLDGRLLPFKKGPFYLAMDSGVAIVPVTIAGTLEIMPKGQAAIRPGTARVIFHDPIDPRKFTDREALMSAVAQSIASALPRGVE